MAWHVEIMPSALDDLRWFGRKVGRILLQMAEAILSGNPLAESKNLKTLRPNPVAERELRLSGKYRVLFNVDAVKEIVTIVMVGEKRKNSLFVQGQEFTDHESDPAK